jgi:capsular polysaccharide biosynthesis protein
MEIETFLRVPAQKWRIILPIFIITVISSAIFTLRQPTIYEARATFVTNLSTTFENDRDFANVLSILSQRVEIATTYAEVAESRRLNQIASEDLGLSSEVRQNLVVNSRLIPGTNIIEITVQSEDPILARDFANSIGESTINYVKNLYEAFTLTPLDEATTPRWPIQPKFIINLILGGVLGMALGVCVAFLIYYFQTSDKSPDVHHEILDQVKPSNNEKDLAIRQLKQEMMEISSQFETTKHELYQIKTALNRNNHYTKDIRAVVRDLEARLEGNHANDRKVDPRPRN